MPKPGIYSEVVKRYPFSARKVSTAMVGVLKCGHAVLLKPTLSSTKAPPTRAWCALCTRTMPKEKPTAQRSRVSAHPSLKKMVAELVRNEVGAAVADLKDALKDLHALKGAVTQNDESETG